MAACGPGIGDAPVDLEQADVAAQTMATLGLPRSVWSYMSGKPLSPLSHTPSPR